MRLMQRGVEVMTNQWVKYTFTCDPDECDALVEFTSKDGFGFPNGVIRMTCGCGKELNYIEREEL